MSHNFEHDTQTTAGTILSGLVPTPASPFVRPVASRDQSNLRRTMSATMPILVVGSLALSMNLTGPIERVEAKAPSNDKAHKPAQPADVAVEDAGVPVAETTPQGEVSTAAAPASYRVAAGDTVSSIAGRYGLSTASVLALNGLGWKSTIFPGQQLKLNSGAATAAPTPIAAAPTAAATGGRYTIVSGDTVSRIASKFGVTTQAILSANGLAGSSIIYPGQSLAIPGGATSAAAPVKASPVSAPVTAAPVASSGTYTIVSGDNLTKIATKLKVSLSSLLAANNLTAKSVIFAGRTLTVPRAVTAPAAATPTGSTGAITLLDGEMEANARVIVSVGRSLGVSDYGIVIALATAMQESSMRNLNYGHLDSVGLFQQRPSSGWGSVGQLTNATHAAKLFYGGPSNPNKGITRGLLDIPGWSSLTVTQAAQKVQISAYPDAYAKWETSARFWLADLK
ncbi:LysM peptidoglycan-binding domain-containing protein [Conyzicola sp.]|uniref:LysM peptidoglycan-binding domain-containing protein n=1 Tax=Conyzicola sp. TaxID=1969404 RepID=UPI0039895292